MPRDNAQAFRAQVLSQPKALVASARNMATLPSPLVRTKHKAGPWQNDAWAYFDAIGEFHYSVSWVGNLLSKASLTILKDGKPTTDRVAVEALAALFGGPDGQAEMFRQLGHHFTVAGEAYLFGAEVDGEDEWFIAAATKTSSDEKGKKWKVDGLEYDSPLAIRMWRPHPTDRFQSDSPTRALLTVLGEIDGLTKYGQAQIDSRLAGAGILLLPSEISFVAPTAPGAEPTDEDKSRSADEFLKTLIQTMATAIGDRSDPSSLVPIVLQVAGEWVDKIKHLTFWSDLDEVSGKKRTEAVTRLGLGLDMPPEILTGTADMNHWSSWQVEEAAIKAHSEPLLAVIVRALTTGYLQPLLQAADSQGDGLTLEEARHYTFGVDDSKMRLRPNRSAEAIELYDRGRLSAEAMLRENGFNPENDKPSDEELKMWFISKVAQGSTTPELVEAALAALGVMLETAGPSTPSGEGETQEARPVRSLEDHPRRQPPAEVDPLTAAAYPMVYRALERAGNRLRTKMGRRIPNVTASGTYQHVTVLAEELDGLLQDSWEMCDALAPALGMTAEALTARLDIFTRELILSRGQFTMAGLSKFLDEAAA